MKAQQIVKINSLKNGSAQLTICGGGKRSMTRRFASIDDAIKFISPLGNRHTQLSLNGYSTVLAGWVM
jgi:hypothetical protein